MATWVTSNTTGTFTNYEYNTLVNNYLNKDYSFQYLGNIYDWSTAKCCYINRRTGEMFADRQAIRRGDKMLEWKSATVLDPHQSMPFYKELRLEIEDWLKDVL